ncbi:3-isopropylmalate dehydratase small subunit [uncultured Parasphingorhabdus sp.]|uniref:3-isopropylmalate dehydratase small subunit n=1 Tax=uncultured Parasphingorhabdus sp. TaxID=2709694 RepID=UPI0030D8FB25
MKKFTCISAVAAPLPLSNIDTDMVLPAQYMKGLTREGLGNHLFQTARYRADGSENPGFILNRPECRHARILITDRNFGCGSSREHAVWAVTDYGIRCIIAPSFGNIFAANARKNGLLLISLPDAICHELREMVAQSDYAPITVDLVNEKIVLASEQSISFSIDANDRHILLHGLDDISRSLQHIAAIERFENAA